MDNHDLIKEGKTYTVLDWLRLFIVDLPIDREKAVERLTRQFRACEYCPFAKDRYKGLCYNHADIYCNNWYAKKTVGVEIQADIDRVNRKVECMEQMCRDKWYNFLGTPLDDELLAKFRKKMSEEK